MERGSDSSVSLFILTSKTFIPSQAQTRPFPCRFHEEKHTFGAKVRLVNFLIEFNKKSINLERRPDQSVSLSILSRTATIQNEVQFFQLLRSDQRTLGQASSGSLQNNRFGHAWFKQTKVSSPELTHYAIQPGKWKQVRCNTQCLYNCRK